MRTHAQYIRGAFLPGDGINIRSVVGDHALGCVIGIICDSNLSGKEGALKS